MLASKTRIAFCASILCCLLSQSAASSDGESIDREKALAVSHSIVVALVNDRYSDIYANMEKAYRDAVTQSRLETVLKGMYSAYGGKPLEAEFKSDEVGYKLYLSGERKPLRKFWYAVRNAKYEKGRCFLVVEIVPDGKGLASCSVMMHTFVGDKIPPQLQSKPQKTPEPGKTENRRN